MSNQLARKLKAARRAADMTQDELAKKLGVTRGAVTQWESPREEIRTNPDMNRLRELANACGVPFTWLIDDKFNPDDARNVRLLNMQGRWREIPVQMEDDIPDRAPQFVRMSLVEPIGGVLHKDTEADLLRADREPDYLPGTHIPSRHPRMAELFWGAVEFQYCGENELNAARFERPISEYGDKAEYFDGRNLVKFSSLSSLTHAPLHRSQEKMAWLLLQEKLYGRALRKILLYWIPTEELPPDAEVTQKIGRLADVDVMFFHDPKLAAEFLRSLD